MLHFSNLVDGFYEFNLLYFHHLFGFELHNA